MATNMIKRERVKRTHSSEQFEMDQHSAYNHSVHSQQHVSGFNLPEDLSEKKIRPSSEILYEDSISAYLPNRFSNHHTPGKDKVGDIEKRLSKRLPSAEEEVAMRASPDSDSILDHSEDCLNPANSMHEFGLNGRPYQLNETTQLETLENFAKEFKQKRIKLGYTQGDVGLAMGKFFKHDFSQTTISRFEALNLSFKNMCKLRPMLEKWLEYTHRLAELSKEGKEVSSLPYDLQVEGDASNGRRRKKRTSIDQKRRDLLDKIFNKNPKPTSDDLHSIAEECGLDKEVVRVWFCNRRQKEKRIQIHEQQSHEEDVTPPDSPRSNIFSIPHQRDSSSRYESLPQRNDLIHPPLSVPGSVAMATSNPKMEDEIPAKRRNVTALLGLQAQDKQRVAKDEPFSPMGKYPNLVSNPMGFSNSNSISHTILRSAHAAQGSDFIPPAYSALDHDQYRKSVSSAKTTDLAMHIPHPNFYSSPTSTNATSLAAVIGKTLATPSGGSSAVLAGINRAMQPSVPTGSQQALNSLLHHASPASLNHSFQINSGNATTT